MSEKTTILQCSGQKNNGSRCTREKEFPVEETPEEWRCWQHFKDDIKIDCCKELTDKQKRFVEEYLVDLNATQAAIRAGYSQETARQIGSENLSKHYIQKEIQKAMKSRSERTEITQDKVLQELAKIGFTDITDFLSFKTKKTVVGRDDNDEAIYGYQKVIEVKDSEKIDGKAISEVQQKDGNFKFKLHDKMKALHDIAKHLGMFEDTINIKTDATEGIMAAYKKRKALEEKGESNDQ